MLKDVNSTDLKGAIALGCQTMASVFNADDNDIPFFGADAWPHAFMDFSPYHGESHVPGRHLNALLNAQAAGIPIDPTAVEKHRKAAFYSFSGPIPVPLNRLQAEGSSVRLPTGTPVRFLDHNLREGMFAMYALARFCDDKEADSMAQKLIQAGVPLEQVGKEVGYRDHSTFYRAFRRQFDLSPREYRAQVISEQNI